MGRRKKGTIPFLKIGNRTFLSILGIMFLTIGLVLLFSFIQLFQPLPESGAFIVDLNQRLLEQFGGLAIFLPFIVILFSGLFFNSKKLKLIKINVVLGLILVLVALLGLFRSGILGATVFENLITDFTMIGGFLILLVTLIVGIILFLDTSVDVFVILLVKLFKGVGTLIKDSLMKEGAAKKKKDDKSKDEEDEDDEEEFIPDRTTTQQAPIVKAKPAVQLPLVNSPKPATATEAASAQNHSGDLHMKPSQHVPTTWVYPPLTLLQELSQKEAERGDVNKNADIIEKTLDSFGIRARVSEVNPGPTVTQYSLTIAIGTKLSKITALGNDLALALAAPSGQVRIEAPIPGRSLVGIEIPNIRPQLVTIKQMLMSTVFTESTDPLLVPLGLDVGGQPIAASISKMPHVLIAGTTGSGKSVMLNAWMATILFRTKPEEVQMILVDPKRVELTGYNGVPHLMTEVIVEPQKILKALSWTVKEMENRYKQFAEAGVRNIEGYNNLPNIQKKPYLIFVIDELADLMMFAPGEAEDMITRIAQMARAVGIHLVLATQRPSVDVITGLMKANIPTRLAFNVSSMIDSRVIIDTPGAEKLLGKGDMLFLPPDQAKPRRIQAPFITEKEVHEVVKFLKMQVPVVHYTEEITENTMIPGRGGSVSAGGSEERDPLFDQAVEMIMQSDKASASLLQRRLKVGYARAARILDELEHAGYIGPADGAKPREILKRQVAEN